ncbi:hypothetical protein [uncultured Tateyamaria sp.]|uniref:hypothetical protein n=1 Tax=uncultured Tateyamaria sp. TaxID=455651 RepID=UPI0026240740|nr:hypothetical protein [uncultured Tateyamaria sp.]
MSTSVVRYMCIFRQTFRNQSLQGLELCGDGEITPHVLDCHVRFGLLDDFEARRRGGQE